MSRQRRPSMGVLSRVPPVAAIVATIWAMATGNATIARPLVWLAVLLAPALLPRTVLYPRPGEAPGPGEEDGGHGRRPGPPKPPDNPRGGLPLPDAEPARVRIRDHSRPSLAPPPPRRAAREPERAPRRRGQPRP